MYLYLRFVLVWSILSFGSVVVISQVHVCQANCESSASRLIGPRHPQTRPHPWKAAVYPSKSKEFCKLGCQYWYDKINGIYYIYSTLIDTPRFNNKPNNITCKASCGSEYRYQATVGYSDLADMSRLECEDGCDIGLLLTQAGYYGQNGSMIPCPFGTYRQDVNLTAISATFPFADVDRAISQSLVLAAVLQCDDCPYGTYRAAIKGTSSLSCTKCPIGKYANQTGRVEFIVLVRLYWLS
jgi:hypothetical protein